jgi:hypothetical protein
MPKDAKKNIDRYKIRGGDLNEFEFSQNQARVKEAVPETQKSAPPMKGPTAKSSTTKGPTAKKTTAKKSAKQKTAKKSAKKTTAKKSAKQTSKQTKKAAKK